MGYLVEMPVSVADPLDGVVRTDLVKVEVEQATEGLVAVARPGQVVARATRSLGEMLAGVRPIAQNFVDSFRGMTHSPDEIGLEFGLSLTAEADVVISSTAAQAHFTVSLTWNRQPAEAGGTGTETVTAEAQVPVPSPATPETAETTAVPAAPGTSAP
ncbi:CU044_2847 family protein [Streptomyces sp. NPDC048603]|uniref:CU044_2847 family protein n=1 Tax=Streptomyces sp. NPDC048603 TaxID=3365577 RepID=UPI00371BFE21